MKISVVGSVLKDVYLNLDTKHEPLETDQAGTSWLDIAFDSSQHHFFSRTASLGGAAISLEVLEKLGLSTSVIGADLKLVDDGLESESLAGDYRYILLADDAVSYFVPDTPAPTPFTAPTEPIDYLYIDRSAHLTPDSAAAINAYLDISRTTRLALYVQNPLDPCYEELIERADLIFLEQNTTLPTPVTPEKIIYLSETEIRYRDIRRPLSLKRTDIATHLSLYSIAAATILGSFILGRSVEHSFALAIANVENSRLNSVLTLSELEKILENSSTPQQTSRDLELIAANLMLAGKGLLAADESGGSIKKKFATLDIPDTYQNRRDYRNIFFTTPHLSDFVNGIILFDETSRQTADNGQNFVDFLTAHQIIPGIKVDQGLAPLDHSLETYTKGLGGLPERLAEYYQRGLRFAKWRSAFEIRLSNDNEIITPTDHAITENCRILAEYAAACQAAGLVPIVEPEVVYAGYYSIDQNAEITSRILDQLFRALKAKNVNLRACLLKVNMVTAGKFYQPASTPDEVGVYTARVLREHVPAELAGVVFLSGGQTPEQTTANLAAVIKHGPFAWPVSFSFARALQDPALHAWQGDNTNSDTARAAFAARLKANTDALRQIDF